jgi:hypothetical protein
MDNLCRQPLIYPFQHHFPNGWLISQPVTH